MPIYSVYAKVVGTKWLGEFEANSEKEAEELAWKEAHVSLCYQCTDEIDSPDIEEVVVELKEE